MLRLVAIAIGLAAVVPTVCAQEVNQPKNAWEPAEMVVGPLPPERFAERLPAWEDRARSWRVDDEVLRQIAESAPARIEIVFASWCPDSFEHLPPLVSALRRAANPALEITLTGVDRSKRDPGGAAARLGVTRVPTVVVFRGLTELGRVVETPVTTMDRDVARLLHAVVGDAPERRSVPEPPKVPDPVPEPPHEP